jgi:hypothetical protein
MDIRTPDQIGGGYGISMQSDAHADIVEVQRH